MALEKILPLERKPAAERVAVRLLELVQSGLLAAGDKLPHENELANALQVSRPVVREALRGLAIMGVVETHQGAACYVTDLRPERLMAPLSFAMTLDNYTIDTLFRARAVIDVGIARDAAERITDAQIAALTQLVATGYQLVRDPVGFRVMDLEFHGKISEAADNAFLGRVARALYELAVDLRRVASETSGVLEQSAKDHEAIAAALTARDREAAGAAMGRHIDHIHRTTVEAMKRVKKAAKPGKRAAALEGTGR